MTFPVGTPPSLTFEDLLARCSDRLRRVHRELRKILPANSELATLQQRRLQKLADDLEFLVDSLDLERHAAGERLKLSKVSSSRMLKKHS